MSRELEGLGEQAERNREPMRLDSGWDGGQEGRGRRTPGRRVLILDLEQAGFESRVPATSAESEEGEMEMCRTIGSAGGVHEGGELVRVFELGSPLASSAGSRAAAAVTPARVASEGGIRCEHGSSYASTTTFYLCIPIGFALGYLYIQRLVGVGEASFISLAAPFIDDNAPPGKTAQWLATFYLCIPVGFALGYLYGGVAGPLLGWRGAFLLEALFMLPFVVYTATAAPPPLKGNPVLLPFPLLASLAPSLASLLATPPSTSAFRSALPSATSTGGWLARCWGGGERFCWKLCSCCRLCSTLLLPPLRPSKVTSFSRAPLLLLTLLSISLSRLCIPVGFALGYLYGGVAPLLGWRGAFLLEALFMLPFVLYTATAAPPPLKNNPLLPCCLPRCSGGRAHASVTASAALADDDEERAEGAPSLATSSQVEATTQLKHGDGSLIDDSLSLARNEIFTINVLGYAAYTFVIGAYAYWAPKAMKEIFNEERADALFGGITVVTGVGGTLFGGLMLDRMGATIPNALLLQSRVTVVGAIFCLLAFASPHILLFVLFMALGEFFIFAIQGPANIVSLQCVPSNLRALAIAAATVVAHLLGDVPSPPILGLLQVPFSLRCNTDGACLAPQPGPSTPLTPLICSPASSITPFTISPLPASSRSPSFRIPFFPCNHCSCPWTPRRRPCSSRLRPVRACPRAVALSRPRPRALCCCARPRALRCCARPRALRCCPRPRAPCCCPRPRAPCALVRSAAARALVRSAAARALVRSAAARALVRPPAARALVRTAAARALVRAAASRALVRPAAARALVRPAAARALVRPASARALVRPAAARALVRPAAARALVRPAAARALVRSAAARALVCSVAARALVRPALPVPSCALSHPRPRALCSARALVRTAAARALVRSALLVALRGGPVDPHVALRPPSRTPKFAFRTTD
ncbi:unnamed protein product [Closterium sp. NIES-65]|nr:unnamed protein product [Closterium sp. NIES-65]